MATIWRRFLEGEIDIRAGVDPTEALKKNVERELQFRKYQLDRNSLSALMDKARRGSNSSANEALFEMSRQEEDVDLKYIFFILVEGCADPWWVAFPDKRVTAIHNFAKNCHHGALEVLRDAGMLDSLPHDGQGYTPLHYALRYDDMRSTMAQEKTLSLLCTCKRNSINSLAQGRSALYMAYEQRSIRAMKVLLEHGASVLVNLLDFSRSIASLPVLVDILRPCLITTPSHGCQLQPQSFQAIAQRLESHPRLSYYVNPTQLSPDMVDYHRPRSSLRLWKWRRGKAAVVDGLVLFRLREELRDAKRNTTALSAIVEEELDKLRHEELRPPLSIDEQAQAQRLYDDDLARRQVGRDVRRKHRGKATKAKRESDQQLRWDRHMEARKDRLEGEYNVKIKGLFVG